MTFSFSAFLLLTLAWAQIDQTELNTQCQPYYDRCAANSTCASDQSTAHGACSTEANNHAYGMCFYNRDASYLAATWQYKQLALCLVENTKTLSDFTCFNNETTVVACDPEILNNTVFNLAPLGTHNIVANTRHDAALKIQWGTMDIIPRPIDWNECTIVNNKSTCEVALSDLVAHMNLHACKITAEQTTCSSKLLENTDADAVVDQTANSMGNQGDYQPYIEFPSAGTWRLLAHIQIYENNTGSTEKIMWDIASGLEFQVKEKPVTPSPTAPVSNEREIEGGGNNVALIICLVLVGLCGLACGYCYFCGVGFKDEEWEEDEDAVVYYEEEENLAKIDEEKETEAYQGPAAVELGKKDSMVVPATGPALKAQHMSPLYAKLMQNSKASTPDPPKSLEDKPSEPLPPAPVPPGNSV